MGTAHEQCKSTNGWMGTSAGAMGVGHTQKQKGGGKHECTRNLKGRILIIMLYDGHFLSFFSFFCSFVVSSCLWEKYPIDRLVFLMSFGCFEDVKDSIHGTSSPSHGAGAFCFLPPSWTGLPEMGLEFCLASLLLLYSFPWFLLNLFILTNVRTCVNESIVFCDLSR